MMSKLRFAFNWVPAENNDSVFSSSLMDLSIYLDDVCLTRNEDIESRVIRDTILVSGYPLAVWFASSWQQLNREPMPVSAQSIQEPPLEWRMTHELGAANHGFVWPRIVFAPDGEIMTVRAEVINTTGQSFRYLCGLDAPRFIEIADFQRSVKSFVNDTLDRLLASGHKESDLLDLCVIEHL